MDQRRELELALWREACRHIDIAESLSDLIGAIRMAVAIESMWIFAVDRPGMVLVAGVCSERSGRRFTLSGEESDRAIRFARKGGLALVDCASPGKSLVRGLAGAVGPGMAIAGGLRRDSDPEGVVMWRLRDREALTDEIAELLATTLEPLAVALDTSRRFHELEDLRRAAEADRQSALRRLGRESLSEPIVGAVGGLKPTMDRVAVVAAQDIPVLILGETGSGKEVIARAIHERSSRHDGPFVRVNCGAIPPGLIDSQLFGHERGAFTGATERRSGWFERADGGTLFLDEIGELSLAAQVRLLRVVQEGVLERVGGQHPVRVDCRIIAATHGDLAAMVRDRTFREDLWYRLAVFPLMLPPLRDRVEDLPELVRHFSDRASTRFGLPAFEIHPEDMASLSSYSWPGNIRELAAVIDRAALLGANHRLAIDAALGAGSERGMRTSARPASDHGSSVASLSDATRHAVATALRASRGRIEGVGGAADLLKINPNTLRSKIRKLGVDVSAFRQ